MEKNKKPISTLGNTGIPWCCVHKKLHSLYEYFNNVFQTLCNIYMIRHKINTDVWIMLTENIVNEGNIYSTFYEKEMFWDE